MNTIKKTICIILALISVFAFNACGKKEEDTTYPPAKVMAIKEIAKDYGENALRADQIHSGQRYRCNAQVVSVNEEYVSAEVWSCRVILYYKGQRDFVMSLSTDDVITFEGTFIELTNGGNIVFEDVVFVEILYNNTPNGNRHYVIDE
ncbi:MAG: hypothetical protein ACI4JG_01820 [Acutalibacteraceae bacterium]